MSKEGHLRLGVVSTITADEMRRKGVLRYKSCRCWYAAARYPVGVRSRRSVTYRHPNTEEERTQQEANEKIRQKKWKQSDVYNSNAKKKKEKSREIYIEKDEREGRLRRQPNKWEVIDPLCLSLRPSSICPVKILKQEELRASPMCVAI